MRPLLLALLTLVLLGGAVSPGPSAARPGAMEVPLALGYVATLGQSGLPWQRSNAYLNQPWGVGGEGDGVWIANGAGRNLVHFGSGAAEDLGRAGDPDALYGLPVRFLADVAVGPASGATAGRPTPSPTPTRRFGPRPFREATPPPYQAAVPRREAASPPASATSALAPATFALSHSASSPSYSTSPSSLSRTGPPSSDSASSLHAVPSPQDRDLSVSQAADRMVWFVDQGGHVAVGIPLAADGTTGRPLVLGETDVPGDDNAHFDGPRGIAVADDGTVFVSDTGNHRVQVFDATGRYVATIGQTGSSGAGAGELNHPARLAWARSRLYIADSGNHRVVAYDVTNPWAPQEVRSYGRVGSPGSGSDQFRQPLGVYADATFLYVADSGNGRVQILRLSNGQLWRTLDGSSPGACAGSGGRWDLPSDVTQDQSGNLYVALPRRMMVMGCDGMSWRARSDLTRGFANTPYLTEDELHNAPSGVALAPDGAVAIVEGEGHRVVVRQADGQVAWTAGKPGVPGAGTATTPRFDHPVDAVYLPDGRLVVADAGNGRLVVLGTDGRLQATWGQGGLESPTGLALLPGGELAVADPGAGRVRRLDAGGAILGDLAGPGGPLTFDGPGDVAVDGSGNWYVSEPPAHVVRVLDSSGRQVRTLGVRGVPGDDFAHLNQPTGLAVDEQGHLLVADTGNNRLQVFAADGTYLTTVGGRRGGGTGGMVEPRGVAVGPAGRVYVADTYNHRVQVFEWAREPWVPAAVNGFGQRNIQAVEALAEFNGQLYAGLRGPSGAAIWRRDGDGPWQQVAADGFGRPSNVGLTALAVFGGQLYAGVENLTETKDPSSGQLVESSSGGGIWRSGDGTRWIQVAAGGFGDQAQSGVGPFAVFGGRLYAATRSIGSGGPQLWRSGSGDPGSWERVRIDLFTRTEWTKNGAISALATYSNTLYVGTCARGGAQVWASAEGKVWRGAGQLTPGDDPRNALPQLGPPVPCLTAFAEYEGRLYAALGSDSRLARRLGRSYSPPVELWRCVKCDGTDWEPAAAAGFGDYRRRGSLTLVPYDEPPFRYLYAFAGSPDQGLDVWRAPDGLDWEQVAEGGFGDDNNLDPGSGSAVLVYQNRLYVGTVNQAHGGELWSSGGTRPGVVPTPPGPTATPTPRPSPQPPTGRARYRKVDEWPVVEPAPEDVMAGPIDMAVADDGEVYLLDSGPVRVLHLLPDRTWGRPFGGTGSGPDRITVAIDPASGAPAALAVDSAAGRVYVSDLGTERLLAFDREGDYLATVLADAYVVDVLVRPDGSLWIADRLAGGVRRIAPDGTELERFGHYGPEDEDGFRGLVAVAEEPGGRLWVADLDGARLRAYERDTAGQLTRVRTVDMTTAIMLRNGCTGWRLQALADGVLLAGRCILEDGRFREGLPGNHRSSDLYSVYLRTVNSAAGHYFALATYDIDRHDAANDVYPAVVQYFDDGFDIVTGYWLGRFFTPNTSDPNTVLDPARIDALPNGELILADAQAFATPPFIRRFSPDGQALEKLSMGTYPSRHYGLGVYPQFVVSTGEPGRIMGLAQLRQGRGTNFEVLIYGQTVRRRYCSNRVCSWGLYVEPIWQTTLVNLRQSRGARDYNYMATYEHTRDQYVLLQLWADNPSDAAMPARLYLFPLAQRGRKTEVRLDGTERQALWTDVDAGPDGYIYVLDTLNDRVQVLDAEGRKLRLVDTPKDAWKVAGGPNGEIFVLTNYGHVVRLAPDGTVLSRFLGLPNDIVPPTAQMDLAVDAWGRVYTIDNLYDLVTVFEPEGIEDDVLEGERCSLGGDKWVAPDEILLGETARLFLQLFGTCGFVEEAADIVLAINTSSWREVVNLRVARQIFAVVDLDRHRVGIVSFVTSGHIEQRLTHRRWDVIRALYDLTGRRPTCAGANNESALREARKVFQDSPPGRRKVLVLIDPGPELPPGRCPWSDESIARTAAELKAEGVIILSVNGPSIACSNEVFSNIPVAQRGQGVGRPAIRRALARTWPDSFVQSGTLVDRLPANIDYVAGSANPPAAWNPVARTLTWPLQDLPRGTVPRFALTIRPQEEGRWPTNLEAVAQVVDGWGQAQRVVLPVPQIRVYGELPPTATFTPSVTPTPAPTDTPEPTPTGRPTTLYLPIALKTEACIPDSRNADVVLLLDASGSMSGTTSPGGPTKLAAAREAARSFLAQMKAGRDQAALIQFNRQATLIVPLTGDLAAVVAGLDRLTQAAGTRIDLALEAAHQELTGPARKPDNNPVLILLTDGKPTGTTPAEVRLAADAVKSSGILVFTIGLGREVDQVLLADVASRPEWFYYAPDTSDLAAIYQQIAYQIPCQPMWP